MTPLLLAVLPALALSSPLTYDDVIVSDVPATSFESSPFILRAPELHSEEVMSPSIPAFSILGEDFLRRRRPYRRPNRKPVNWNHVAQSAADITHDISQTIQGSQNQPQVFLEDVPLGVDEPVVYLNEDLLRRRRRPYRKPVNWNHVAQTAADITHDVSQTVQGFQNQPQVYLKDVPLSFHEPVVFLNEDSLRRRRRPNRKPVNWNHVAQSAADITHDVSQAVQSFQNQPQAYLEDERSVPLLQHEPVAYLDEPFYNLPHTNLKNDLYQDEPIEDFLRRSHPVYRSQFMQL